ncbi:hypothetical protein UlMin_031281 [Ulmus minor]
MFGLCCKKLRFPFQSFTNARDSLLIQPFSSKRALSDEEKKQERSFTISYLSNFCGLSPEIAISVSKKLHLDSPEKPDSVLRLLKDNGFSDAHISKLIKFNPHFLLANPESTLLPKLEFFQSIGLSGADLVATVSRNPAFLTRSLEKSIIPLYNILKKEVFLDKKVAALFERLSVSRQCLNKSGQSNIVRNIAILRSIGMPQSLILNLMSSYCFTLHQKTEKFRESVEKVSGMGFNPLQCTFIQAFAVISFIRKSTWDEKMELYKKCGWSEDEILSAFRKSPLIMKLSAKNITSKMDVLVNKMQWQSSDVARVPSVLYFSLEKRIIPRCLVIRVLLSKGLIKEELPLSTTFVAANKYFLAKFVVKYQENVPELSSIFHGKMSLGFEGKCGEKIL